MLDKENKEILKIIKIINKFRELNENGERFCISKHLNVYYKSDLDKEKIIIMITIFLQIVTSSYNV